MLHQPTPDHMRPYPNNDDIPVLTTVIAQPTLPKAPVLPTTELSPEQLQQLQEHIRQRVLRQVDSMLDQYMHDHFSLLLDEMIRILKTRVQASLADILEHIITQAVTEALHSFAKEQKK